jgi:type IV pilus assembly protein PilO
MKLGIRETAFLACMLGLLGSTYWFVFKQANKRRIDMQAEIALRTQTLEQVRTQTAGIEDLQKKIDELQKAILVFESKLPKAKELDTVVRTLSELAAANHLNCTSIKTLKTEKGPNYSEQPIELTLEGDFRDFYAFLLQMEKQPRIMRTHRLNMGATKERDGRVAAGMTVSIFFDPSDGSTVAGVK